MYVDDDQDDGQMASAIRESILRYQESVVMQQASVAERARPLRGGCQWTMPPIRHSASCIHTSGSYFALQATRRSLRSASLPHL